jgi:hypothetical protein
MLEVYSACLHDATGLPLLPSNTWKSSRDRCAFFNTNLQQQTAAMFEAFSRI